MISEKTTDNLPRGFRDSWEVVGLGHGMIKEYRERVRNAKKVMTMPMRNTDDFNALEEYLYGLAGKEIAERLPKPGVWSKAFSDAEGDGPKAVANYIRLRVPQLREELREELPRRMAEQQRQAERLARQEAVARKKELLKGISAKDKLIAIKCCQCKASLYVPKNAGGRKIKCRNCGAVQLMKVV